MSKDSSKTKKKVSVRPVGDKILLKEIEEKDTKTASGIILPDGVGENEAKKAKVIAIGDGRKADGKTIEFPVAVGDIVYYTWGDKIVIDGEKFILASVENINAVLN